MCTDTHGYARTGTDLHGHRFARILRKWRTDGARTPRTDTDLHGRSVDTHGLPRIMHRLVRTATDTARGRLRGKQC